MNNRGIFLFECFLALIILSVCLISSHRAFVHIYDAQNRMVFYYQIIQQLNEDALKELFRSQGDEKENMTQSKVVVISQIDDVFNEVQITPSGYLNNSPEFLKVHMYRLNITDET